ncbi:MAG: dynamin family protein [Nitrospiraceae bacterium]|nr:MAG: dynamin family protein [Nitrospiraceae bacterium]
MKEQYNSLKTDLLGINDSLSLLLSKVQGQPDIADPRFDEWKNACRDINRQIREEVVRIAVIGSVKSGKSTLVNSIFKGDYLKRGAGVVTSIVTRIRNGKKLKAELFFKSWEEINSEIQQALVMFPAWEKQNEGKSFDIRQISNRQILHNALESLSDDLQIIDGTRNTNSVLLSLYIKGYSRVAEMITSGRGITKFKGKQFAEHRIYAGDDELAVYLKDIELEISGKDLDSSVEIADCQGSDSPNPMHLAMIQDYLLQTHFIVYVISSRTGVRQADIRFLSIIKKMGMLGNIIFVVNTDFSEHESLSDMQAIIARVRQELALIKPDPEIYALSALLNLFRAMSDSLKKKDSLRLAQWMAEDEMVGFSDRETERFNDALQGKLTRDRSNLLLHNHLERMDIILNGVESWAGTYKDLLVQDMNSASEVLQRMERHQERMDQLKSLIKNTLDGARDDIMKELKKDIDSFFNVPSEGVLGQTRDFVGKYDITVEKYLDQINSVGFSNTLYQVFQEFKQAIDTFMTRSITPELASFAGKSEAKVRKKFETVARSFQSMVSDDMYNLKASIKNTDIQEEKLSLFNENLLDLDSIKRISGLKLPSSSTTLQYSAKVRTEAIMRLGLYSLTKFFKKAFKKPVKHEMEEQMRALADGFKLIKQETEKSIVFHFENYRENLKFQYISKLVDAATEYLRQRLMERFRSYHSDISTLEKVMQKKGQDKEYMIEFLEGMDADIKRLKVVIDINRGKLKSIGSTVKAS